MTSIKILHMTTHVNVGGISTYIYLLGRQMNQNGYDISVLSSGGEMTERMREAGIRTFELPFRTKSELSPKLYWALPKIIKLVKKEKINLIHAHTRVTQVMAWWVRHFTGVPYVSTCHGFYKRRLGRIIFPAWGNHVIAISAPVEESIRNTFGVSIDRVSTIFNAIDADDLNKRTARQDVSSVLREWKLEQNPAIIGVVARIVYDKGHEYLIRAFDVLMKEKCPAAKLLIVGEGPYKYKIVKLVEQLKLQDSVRFIGTLADVTKALAVIDIFVLPAIWREGFGLSIIEAMALKKPVIVTNIWALNALVQNRQNGLLVEPKNAGELVDAINELLEDRTLGKRIGEAGYEMVRREFSIDRMAAQMDQLYRKVIGSNQTHATQLN